MPNKIHDIDDELQRLIDMSDEGRKPTDEEWQSLSPEAQDDLLLLGDIGEALCRAPQRNADKATEEDTEAAWLRMRQRLETKPQKQETSHRHTLRVALWAAVGVAAAIVLAVLVTRPDTVPQAGGLAVATHKASQKPQTTAEKDSSPAKSNGSMAASNTASTFTATITAATRQAKGSAGQLIMDLENQGYTVDGQIQRSSQAVEPGKLAKVVLPDGTEAYLYASSKLTYPSTFVGGTRDVALEGEAYFKVTHDAAHPFIIHAAGATTRVLGTELNVRAYQGEPLHVALVTGVAEVVGNGGTCRLQPGEGVTVVGGDLVKRAEDMDSYSYALKGFLYADNMPLGEVAVRLAHWYGMGLEIGNRQSAEQRIHFFMRGNDTPGHAAELLSGMGDFSVTVKDGKFVIK